LIVVDASLTAAWLLDEPSFAPASDLFDLLASESILVPAHWPTEVGNALRKAVRMGRLSNKEIAPLIERLALFDIVVATPISVNEIGSLTQLALEHRLSVYDAAYIQMAAAQRLALVTVDRAMRAAAARLNVSLLPA
jgi:predicted nucleic acid-binding protein